MRERTYRYYAADFETTVFEGQTFTEVWSAAMVEFGSEEVEVYHSIGEWWAAVKKLKGNICLYFHNLKFDGHFIIDYFIRTLNMRQGFDPIWGIKDGEKDIISYKKLPGSKMVKDSFNYSISDMGQWYSITVKTGGRYIEIRDSLKLMPFTLKAIGKAFKTKHQKLEMEYKGERFAGCEITDEEMQYIKNDVLVLKEALEYMFSEGHNKLTIGSCCLDEWKSGFADWELEEKFPNLYEIAIDKNLYGYKTAGDYIHSSYKGAWCYLVKGKECKRFYNGITADVNSLYPSVMHSDSGNKYPIGKPVFWKGDIPDRAIGDDKFYFVRIRTKFYIKPGMLPCIQVKNNPCYRSNEWLESSDIDRDGKQMKGWVIDGVKHEAKVTMTLTMMDYELIQKHYDLVDLEVLDGCWFWAESGMFDEYLNKYKKIKMTSKGAKRTEAKLFQNNLYGKMATNTDSSFKMLKLSGTKNGNILTFNTVEEYEKIPGYIPIGSAITSYARCFTITAAQANYHGPDNPGFIYADTDSIHCDISADEVKGITVHPTEYLCWKLEACWDVAWFTRQKTYIEHIVKEDMEDCEPRYKITCAGMGKKSKSLLEMSLNGEKVLAGKGYSVHEADFVNRKRDLEDFREGLVVPGKLIPKRMPGGIVLIDTDYEMN